MIPLRDDSEIRELDIGCKYEIVAQYNVIPWTTGDVLKSARQKARAIGANAIAYEGSSFQFGMFASGTGGVGSMNKAFVYALRLEEGCQPTSAVAVQRASGIAEGATVRLSLRPTATGLDGIPVLSGQDEVWLLPDGSLVTLMGEDYDSYEIEYDGRRGNVSKSVATAID
jgi:hypothetical protein